ncbi:MAG: FAD-binding oxidoreductase [Alphaproteobacteria bacterium]|nr:FAD-binding oxidoreductase [Alphaproteobacteria bacterium]
MRKSYDVVIVGGGVIGSAIAYFLAASDAFSGTVLVVERDPTYAGCSTTLSAGSIRQQFSTSENIEISKFGIAFLRDIGAHLTVDGEAPEVAFQERGFLFLADPEGLPILRGNHEVQRAHDCAVALLDPDELTARFPWLNVDGIAAGSLGLANEGWFDPYALLRGFRRKARALGADYATDEAVALAMASGRVQSVALAAEGPVGCGVVVNAAGPRAGQVAAMAGLELPVHPRKRSVFVFECRAELPHHPLLINVDGVYVRPEGPSFICGVSPPPDRDPDCLDHEVEYWLFEDIIWPSIAHRVPAYEAIKPGRAWAGHYAYNTFDQNAVLGPHPDLTNFYFANGFSGHGLQQSPAVGRATMERIVHGAYQSLDLSRLDYTRIAAGAPVVEQAVV